MTWVTGVCLRLLMTTASVPPNASKLTRSSVPASMTMAATSREKRRRRPLAERSMFSLAPEPLNESVSIPSWPLTE